MSGSIDERIVGLKMDNRSLEQGARTSLSTLDKLKAALNFSQSTKSMNDLQNTASRFNMGGMGATVEGVSKKFLAMGAVAVTALANITNRAVDAGINMAKSLTVAPIMQGFHEYETTLNSIQTVLANTQAQGTTLADVNGALKQLNTYSDKTIYNFTEMARNIGTFTAAGVHLDVATASIKGIANLAALSGSNSQQASTAMYQLSQAISNNKVGLQDWNSVVNAGMGGRVMQEALFNMGKMQGTLKHIDAKTTFDQWTKAGNSFRNSLQDGWVTGDVLTTTLKAFTLEAGNSYSKAQKQALAAKGFSDEQIATMEKQARTATDAATKVKTFTQLMDTLKEAVGSGWTRSFQMIFGNFNEARDLWTGVSNSVGGLIQNSAKARNKVLGDWKALGGRTVLIQGIEQMFKNLGAVIKPIKDAFRDIFPAATGRDLYNLTVTFTNFMKRLEIGSGTAEKLHTTFLGVFSVFHIIGSVLGGVFHLFADLFGLFTDGTGSVLDLTAGIGEWLHQLDLALTKGGALNDFFQGLEDILRQPLSALVALKDQLFGLFDNFHPGGANTIADTVSGIGTGMTGLSNIIQGAWDKANKAFDSVSAHLEPVRNAFHNFFSSIGDAFGGAGLSDILHTFNTVFLGGIAVAISRFLKGGFKLDVGGGFLGKLGEALDGLTGNLQAMQMELKAKALMEIGVAIALLTASVVALSLIKPKKLEAGVKGLGIVFLELVGAVKLLSTITSGTLRLPVVAASLVLLAGAIDLLVLAVVGLSRLNWEDLKHGLTGVGILLAEVSAATLIISKNSGSMVSAGVGITAMAVGINILARAVKYFAGMEWDAIKKGLLAVGLSLGTIAVGMRAMPPGLAAQGIGLAAIAASLLILSRAVQAFAALDWHVIGHGLVGIGSALLTIAVGMRAMPKGMVAQAAALILIGVALKGIAGAVAKMGAINFKTMAKGLAGIGVALGILAIGLRAMKGTVGASIALGIAAAALTIFVPTLKRMGDLDIMEIVKGLIAMAGAFTVIGIAGRVLSSTTGAITALSLALIAFGAAMTLIGGGVYLLGKGFGYLAEHGAEGIKVLLDGLGAFLKRVPEIAVALANGLVDFLGVIGDNAPKIVGALAKVLDSLMNAIIDELPTALRLFGKLIHTFIKAINDNAGDILDAAINLLVKFLNKIADAMPKVVAAGANLIVQFLKGIGDNLAKVIDQAFVVIVKFVNGVADAVDKHLPELMKAGTRLLWAIIHGFAQGLVDSIEWLWGKVEGFFADLWGRITRWFDIHSPSRKAAGLGRLIVEGIWDGIKGAGGWLWHLVEQFMEDLWKRFTHSGDGINPPGWAKKLGEGLDTTDPKDLPQQIAPEPFDPTNPNPGGGGRPLQTAVRPAALHTENITPVVDLGPATKNATLLGSRIVADISRNHAVTISKSAEDALQATADAAAESAREVTFQQYNYSPKALSPVEIFRNTRSQLAFAKEALST